MATFWPLNGSRHDVYHILSWPLKHLLYPVSRSLCPQLVHRVGPAEVRALVVFWEEESLQKRRVEVPTHSLKTLTMNTLLTAKSKKDFIAPITSYDLPAPFPFSPEDFTLVPSFFLLQPKWHLQPIMTELPGAYIGLDVH